jgi:hypothetical protein
MNPWDLDVNLSDVILDFLYLSTFLIIGTLLKAINTMELQTFINFNY